MKHTVSRYSAGKAPAYPNAASGSYYLHRLLNIVMAIVSGLGLMAALVFLVLIT